jgi:beta-glucosidase
MLTPGETKTIQFTLPAASFRLLNKDMQWAWEPGAIRIMIGASSADIRLRDHIYLK